VTACPEVTVVLPTHDRAGLVAEALRSALDQEDVDFELIVVDDGSADATPELLAGETDPRLQFIRNETPRGVAAARNQALREAQGTWLAFLDDDDLWAPRWLRTALDAAEGGGPAVIYGSRLMIDERRRVRSGHLAEDPGSVAHTLIQCNALGGPSAVIVHRDVIAAAGPFDERLSALADWEAWLRFLARARPVAVPDLLVGYTVYPDNMHRRDPFGVLAEFHRFRAIVAERLGPERVPPEAPFLRWLGRDVAELGGRWAGARLFARAARIDGPRDLAQALRCLLGRTAPPGPDCAAPEWLARIGRGAQAFVGSR
jgi:glycosyltransferase involved in cell wall biosynthesis